MGFVGSQLRVLAAQEAAMADTPLAEILAFYRMFGAMADGGAHAALFDVLPDDVGGIAKVVAGLLLHQHIAPAYGERLSPERIAEAQIRPAEKILDCVLKHDKSALTMERPLSKRTIGVCRHYTLLLVVMLRAKGYAARSRCGFASYFEKGKFLDHWVGEYWNHDRKRWVMVDAQMDEVQRKVFRIDFDPLDVPRDHFLIAGDAWKLCRDGKANPSAFGIMDMNGWWFIAGNVVRDIAALNKTEMLPWDVWGEMPQVSSDLNAAQMNRFDDLAALTRDPDKNFDALVSEYKSDALKVPPVVFNAVLQKPETV
jgi:hypothetical protein